MPFQFKTLSVASSIVVATAVATPGHAQQDPPAAGQERTDAAPPDSPATHAPARASRPRSAAVTATVNLRSGPGTDSEIITTIPAGSTVRITNCSGEWCEVTWNEHSGYAIARNLSVGASRQARPYGPPGYGQGYGPEPPVVYGAPGYYAPPAVVYGPAYYYGPRIYYGPGWGWRRRWW
ncbi:MAG TPA: SH3 domain-containing protein [Xanthobacteraceae bacterium]|nr:SH3 domain-containing protein [Xanthobacteraceae bacterium]